MPEKLEPAKILVDLLTAILSLLTLLTKICKKEKNFDVMTAPISKAHDLFGVL